jgi:hypothetical protein
MPDQLSVPESVAKILEYLQIQNRALFQFENNIHSLFVADGEFGIINSLQCRTNRAHRDHSLSRQYSRKTWSSAEIFHRGDCPE